MKDKKPLGAVAVVAFVALVILATYFGVYILYLSRT